MSERGRPRNFDRNAALARAMELFWRCGYEGTSVGDLAAAMGIGKPSLYAAFGCKEALFRESVTLYDAVEGEATERAFNDEQTAREAVAAMLRNNADAYTHPGKPNGCMIVLAAMTGTPENAEVRDYLAQLRRDGENALRQRLDRGIVEGDVPKGTDTATLASYYTSVLQGLSIQARDGSSRATLEAIINTAMTTWDTLSKNNN